MAKKSDPVIPENYVQLDFSEEMKNSYRDYALSVIISRALPDVRDGLKPVQRRILYAMSELGLENTKPHRKSARIVGDTMGKYHPHGDSSIYEALVHMSEDYSLSIPLIDGHGNFGSLDGDSPAAMRYTEARLSKGAMTMLTNLDKGLVEFMPNFDDSEQEPTVLPAMLPNLLINGTTGIAVGMATNIPPHNPGEVIDGVIACMDNPDITIEELMAYIPGPDFPTGGMITNASEIRGIYETGEGRLRVRAKTEIENGDGGRKNIIVSEIPFTAAGSKGKLVENLMLLTKDKVFDEIYDVRDESSKDGVRIVIEVKKDRNIENLLNGLFKKSGLEDTYAVNMLAVKGQQPYTFNLKSILQEFIAFQEELCTREHKHLLEKAEKRQEVLSGLIRAVDIIDLIIEILRGSTSVKQAKACLIDGDVSDIRFKSEASRIAAFKLDFTEAQADAILAMPLVRLIGLELNKLCDENAKLEENIALYRKILSDRRQLDKVIKERLRGYLREFGRERRTVLTDAGQAKYVEEFREEELYVLIDRFGYTKSVDAASITKAAPESLAEFTYIIKTKNTDKLCIFTDKGNLYQIKLSSIPKQKLKDKGTLIHSLCKFDKEEAVSYMAFADLFESMLFFATKNGYVKLVSGAEFETNRTVIASTKLDDNDEVIAVNALTASEVISGAGKIVLLTKKGLSLGFSISELVEMKKTGRGVRGITLDDGDPVVFASFLADPGADFTYNGKVISAKKIKCNKRGGKGKKAQL